MLTKIQSDHLKGYTCPSCKKPLGRFHCYPVTPPTLLSRLTDTVPMHQDCARKAAPLLLEHAENRAEWLSAEEDHAAIIWVVKSAPTMPSGRLFERIPGDWMIHLFSPHQIEFYISKGTVPESVVQMQRPSYAEIRALMLPAVKAAMNAAKSEEEVDEIARAIAALHPYLPKAPKAEPQ